MTNKYYESLDGYGKRRYDEHKAKAMAFLNQKQKTKAYHVYGYDSLSEEEIKVDYFVVLTDDEVSTLSEYLIQHYNSFELEDAVSSLEEFMQTDDSMFEEFYQKFRDEEGLWNKLVCQPLEACNMIPTKIDFLDYTYLFRFDCFLYNDEKNQMEGPYEFLVSLTDEEYVTLLTLQLDCRRNLTFNRLFSYCPELAEKISNSVESYYFDPRIPDEIQLSPFAVVLTEIIDDANIIKQEEK